MKKTIRRQVQNLAFAASLISMTLLAVVTGLVSAEQTLIYKSIAEDGSTVFTDQPAPEATIINPSPLNVMDELPAQPAATQPATTTAPASDDQPTTIIDSVIIEHPTNQQTLIDPKEQIWVEFTTSPASSLPVGMTANVRLDNTLVVTGSSYRMPVDVPERGTHQLQVQLVDRAGSIVAESDVIEIHIKQHAARKAN
jgi:hypothetical protein